MQDLSEYSNPNLFSIFCEVSEGKYSPYLNCQEGNSVVLQCDNTLSENIITCKNPYKLEFIKEAGDIKLDLPISFGLPFLPSYLPICDKSKIILDEEFVGISLTDILKKGIRLRAGMLHEQEIMINEFILQDDIYKNKKVILFLTGPDTLIEWLWYNREEINFFKKVKKMGFWGMCGFNFSVIGGECAFSQALNQKRSLLSTFMGADAGLLSMPHVYALNKFHADRWLNWFRQNPSVNYFVTNCQLQKSDYDIIQVTKIIRYMLTEIPHLNVILQGFPLNRIGDFYGMLDRIHFADKGAIKYAQSKVKLEHNIKKNVLLTSSSNEKFEDLARHNINVKRIFIEYNKNLYRRKVAA